MKRTYLAPKSIITYIKTETILSGSLVTNTTGGHSTFYEEEAGGEALTREESNWSIW